MKAPAVEAAEKLLQEVIELEIDRKATLALLMEVVLQATSEVAQPGLLDSMAISAYADALRFLARYGYVEIIEEHGRRVIAREV